MPELPEIPEVGIDDEEVQLARERGRHAKKGKKRREGCFIPQRALETLHPGFPGNAQSKVFFLILTTAARYREDVAFLSLDEIAAATGLPKRTAEYAVSQLKDAGFIRREGRYRIAVPNLGYEAEGTRGKTAIGLRSQFSCSP